MVLAYKPTNPYNQSNNTQIDKDNFITSLINYGERIGKFDNHAANSTKIIYTVPEGFTFYLITYQMIAAANTAYFGIGDTSLPNTVTLLTGLNATVALSPSIPIKVNSTEKITLRNTGVSNAFVLFVGYLIPTATLQNLK